MSIGIPVKILHEAEGHVITCETTDGQTYRGTLSEAEDSMNIHMSNVQVTNRDGSISAVPNIVIRGSKVVFLILPDMLKHAPVFKTRTGAGRSQPAPTITTGGARRGGRK